MRCALDPRGTRQCKITPDHACRLVSKYFDFELSFSQELRSVPPSRLPKQFVLGVVVGPSGCGKSSMLARLDPKMKTPAWDDFWSVESQVSSSSLMDGRQALKAAQLPMACWRRPYSKLSMSERTMADLARLLATDRAQSDKRPVCVDEFTSFVDRATARRISQAVAAHVRRRAARAGAGGARSPGARAPAPVVLATVHDDVLKWLQPDWIFFPETGKFLVFEGSPPTETELLLAGAAKDVAPADDDNSEVVVDVRKLLKAPSLDLTAKAYTSKPSMGVFRKFFEEHHYMKGILPTFFPAVVLLRDQVPVAFCAISNQFGYKQGSVTMRESRLVVLPAFQGFGIGPRLSGLVGDRLLGAGYRFFSRTHHPRLGQYRDANPRWRATMDNHKKDSSRGIGSGALARTRKTKQKKAPKKAAASKSTRSRSSGGGSEGSDAFKQEAQIFSHQYVGDTVDGNDALTEKVRVAAAAPDRSEAAQAKRTTTTKAPTPQKRNSSGVVVHRGRSPAVEAKKAAVALRVIAHKIVPAVKRKAVIPGGRCRRRWLPNVLKLLPVFPGSSWQTSRLTSYPEYDVGHFSSVAVREFVTPRVACGCEASSSASAPLRSLIGDVTNFLAGEVTTLPEVDWHHQCSISTTTRMTSPEQPSDQHAMH